MYPYISKGVDFAKSHSESRIAQVQGFLVNALVRNLAHETSHGARGFLVDAVCPNHSRTDMGGPDAPLSAAEGASTAIWLATRPFDASSSDDQVRLTGLLWEERQVVPW